MLKERLLKLISYGVFILSIGIFLNACRTDFNSQASGGYLSFSKDTVYLDTVFTTIGSSSYSLKVYNPSNKDIYIPSIQLAKGTESYYRLNVDGIPGKEFHDIHLLAKDSMFVFIETNVNIEALSSEKEYLYTDQIIFSGTDRDQSVELVTLVKDAIFLYPKKPIDLELDEALKDLNTGDVKLKAFYLEDEHLNLSADLPYVIYGYAVVAPEKKLSIQAGARLYFHKDSGIIVSDKASIHANGMPSNDRELMENEIIFQANRLEAGFKNTPGQWGTIWLMDGSTGNYLKHTTIKNATLGLLVEASMAETQVELNNVQIYNHASYGILARKAQIKAANILIAECGLSALALTYGGDYSFTHATIANYWSHSFQNTSTILLSNQKQLDSETIKVADLTKANFYNSIIYGTNPQALVVDKHPDNEFNFKFYNSLLRLEPRTDQIPDYYAMDNENFYSNVIFNKEPMFIDTKNLNYRITTASPAHAIGNAVFSSAVPKDLDNQNRLEVVKPDAGAYQIKE